MIIQQKPEITTTSLPSGTVGEEYSKRLEATGTTPITLSASGLPNGLSCSAAGMITGTPTVNGTYTVKLTATNSAGSSPIKSLPLNVNVKVVRPTITMTSLLDGYTNEEYSVTLTATETAPIMYTASGLPDGLSCASSTGKITGTPTTEGTFSVTIEASAYSRTASKTLTLTIKAVKL